MPMDRQVQSGDYVYGRLPKHILLQVTKVIAHNIRSGNTKPVRRDA
jgi:hypothetical protein